MTYIIAGLGNPGNEYEKTRHNTGRLTLSQFHKTHGFSPWEDDQKKKAIVSSGKVGKENVLLVLPDNFMNNSGKVLAQFVKSKKSAEKLAVLYDDLDLPLGNIKLSYNRGSGGHKGLASIIRALKTKEFVRVRVGIAPTTPSGKLKKLKGEQKVLDFIMDNFTPKEEKLFKDVYKRVSEALDILITKGREHAMNQFN